MKQEKRQAQLPKFFLEAAAKPEDMPAWITQELLERCMRDKKLQSNWEPKVGDFYFCKDVYSVSQITDLDGYYNEGKVPPLASDHGKDAKGHWTCDIYLAEPSAAK